MQRHLNLIFLLAAMLVSGSASAEPLTRRQALDALAQPGAPVRLAAIERLAGIGSPADAERVLDLLGDTNPDVREAAAVAVWKMWSRSGDPKIDRLFAVGIEQMQQSALHDALATFNDIVRQKPSFAEGWNKRATIHFLLGENQKSLKDCDEVLARNPRHFGALSGAGQIHLQLGHLRPALAFFRRAVEVNPTLDGLLRLIPMIEERLREDDKNMI